MSTKRRPLISCVIPVLNGEAYIGETLDSIAAQTYRPLQIVVIDDGSTDRTAEIVRAHAGQILYHYQENRGIAAACNRGIDMASGEFVAFLDADDLWPARKLALQMARFDARPELDYCVGHAQNFWMPELAQEEEQFKDHPRSRPVPGYVCGSLMARKKTFETVGGFDESLRHGYDTDWYLRARQSGCVEEAMPDVLLLRRVHKQNRSRMHAGRSHGEYLRLLKQNLDRRRRSAATDSEDDKTSS